MLLTGLLAACGQPSSQPGSPSSAPTSGAQKTVAELRDVVDDIANQMSCKTRFEFDDDVYFWDRAVGVNCEHDDGSVGTVMAYRHPESVAAVLQDREGQISESKPALASKHVLVTAEPQEIKKLAKEAPKAGKVITDVPSPPSLTSAQEQVGMCVSFVASDLATYAAGQPEPDSDVRQLDSTYPGYKDWITEFRDSAVAKKLKKLKEGEPAFEPTLSKIGPKAKSKCRSSIDGKTSK